MIYNIVIVFFVEFDFLFTEKNNLYLWRLNKLKYHRGEYCRRYKTTY